MSHLALGRRNPLAPLFERAYDIISNTVTGRRVITQMNLRKNLSRPDRRLEIGPGEGRIPGFETLGIEMKWTVDYVADATGRFPFPDNTFALIYASHILEHVPWYQTGQTLAEWVRVLRPGGQLEIWVPNALEICRAFVDYETTGKDRTHLDGWYRYNPEKDPCKWAAGRIFTYGDGSGNPSSPNWHRALFSPRYLKLVMERAGLVDVEPMSRKKVRGCDHGWINLGMKGTKPSGASPLGASRG